MVFVYAPTMLLVLPEYYSITGFLHVSLTCAASVLAIATAVSGYFLANLSGIWRIAMAISGILPVATGMRSDIFAVVVALPVLAMQWRESKKSKSTAGAAADT